MKIILVIGLLVCQPSSHEFFFYVFEHLRGPGNEGMSPNWAI